MPINSFENYPMSWKPSIDKTEKPIYQALAGQLEQDILNGALLPGTKLPPQRELADYLDLNLSTISKAFKVCELKGLLSATVGSGTFVSYDALSNAYLLEDTKPKHLIEMGATLPDNASYVHYYFPTKQELVQAVLLRYRKHFIEKLDQIDKSSSDAKEKLNGFFNVYRDTLKDNGKICLCSMMAAELNSFPEEIRNELTLFFRANEEWLENVLKQGMSSGTLITRSTDEVKQAKIIVAFVQGAQLLARSTGEIDYYDSLIKDFYDDF